jgi:hypothetical protein
VATDVGHYRLAVDCAFAPSDRPQAGRGGSRHPNLTSGDEVRERIRVRRHDQCRDPAVIGDLDGLPVGDMTQDLTALIAHLAMSNGPHVAQRSTLFWCARFNSEGPTQRRSCYFEGGARREQAPSCDARFDAERFKFRRDFATGAQVERFDASSALR